MKSTGYGRHIVWLWRSIKRSDMCLIDGPMNEALDHCTMTAAQWTWSLSGKVETLCFERVSLISSLF